MRLVSEGVRPSNKGPGYVLRKLIRRMLIKVWLHYGQPSDISPFVADFASLLASLDANPVDRSAAQEAISHEDSSLRRIIAEGGRIIGNKTGMDPKILADTYGLTPDITELIRKKG